MRWANSEFQGGSFFFLPQANWCAGVALGVPIQLMGCFEVYPSTGRVSDQNMNVTDLIMPLPYFIFLGCHFVSPGFISLWNVRNKSYD